MRVKHKYFVSFTKMIIITSFVSSRNNQISIFHGESVNPLNLYIASEFLYVNSAALAALVVESCSRDFCFQKCAEIVGFPFFCYPMKIILFGMSQGKKERNRLNCKWNLIINPQICKSVVNVFLRNY